MGPRTLPYLQVPQSGLDGAADESLICLPRGHIPRSDRRVLVQQLGHGSVRLGRAAFRRFLEQSAKLDVGLLLGLGGGLEADLAPGERIGPDVYGDTERPARQLLYVTFGNPGHTSRVTLRGDIRPTEGGPVGCLPLLTWSR